MEECEICGSRTNDVYIVNVEDVELRVCPKCAKGKKIVSRPSERANTSRKLAAAVKADVPQLVENYGTVIHNGREAMRLPLKVLAEMLNEKETLLLRVEQQRTMPSMELAKALEKALGIKLTESGQPQADGSGYGGKGEKVTLGDYIKRGEKK